MKCLNLDEGVLDVNCECRQCLQGIVELNVLDGLSEDLVLESPPGKKVDPLQM